MKKISMLILAAILGLALLSCATSADAKPAAAKPASAAPEKAAINWPDNLMVCDFEDKGISLPSYNGGGSAKVISAFVADPVHAGKQALKATMNTADYAGLVLEVPAAVGDWSAYQNVRIWVYGTGSGAGMPMVIEDKNKEQFMAQTTDDSAGWKEKVIPISAFIKRTDYQASDARLNGKIDYPIMTFHFFTANSFTGDMVFDDISVSK